MNPNAHNFEISESKIFKLIYFIALSGEYMYTAFH